jgi:hypothetical protein
LGRRRVDCARTVRNFFGHQAKLWGPFRVELVLVTEAKAPDSPALTSDDLSRIEALYSENF